MGHSLNTSNKLQDGIVQKQSWLTLSELQYRKAELEKMNSLDVKIREETETLKAKIEKMKDELITFSDINGFKANFENSKKVLLSIASLNVHSNLRVTDRNTIRGKSYWVSTIN